MNSVADVIDDYLKRMTVVSNQVHQAGEVYEEFLSKLKNLISPETEIATTLAELVSDPCRKRANLWLIAAQLHPSVSYLDPLIRILEIDDPCVWHEAIVDFVYDLPVDRATKVSTIPSLRKALNYHYDYDYGYSLTKKILETLALIGAEECWTTIKTYLSSQDIAIRELAEILLEEADDSDRSSQN